MNTQIIAIANQKGGVGKTTTCANLGIGLAQAGKKVLLIDGDPQGSLTISLGHPQPDKLPFTLSDAMGRILMDEALRPGEGILHHPEGVDLMPADIQLSGMEVSLVNAMSRETILRQYLDTVKGQYSHMEILKVQGLCKTYGKGEAKVEALKKVYFSLNKGEFAAVVGESGSGKSTLLNCIGALDTPTSGHILVDGQDLFSMKEEQRTIFRRRNIGFIFQSFQLVSELNVEQNIIFPLLLDYRKPDPAVVEEILDLLGLTERRHHLLNQLSGGQQQRVAIGRALITKPKLILADEPTGNLDSKNSQDVMALLTQASRRYQQTILMITHNKNLTASVDRVFRVSDGVLTDLGGKKNEALS